MEDVGDRRVIKEAIQEETGEGREGGNDKLAIWWQYIQAVQDKLPSDEQVRNIRIHGGHHKRPRRVAVEVSDTYIGRRGKILSDCCKIKTQNSGDQVASKDR